MTIDQVEEGMTVKSAGGEATVTGINRHRNLVKIDPHNDAYPYAVEPDQLEPAFEFPAREHQITFHPPDEEPQVNHSTVMIVAVWDGHGYTITHTVYNAEDGWSDFLSGDFVGWWNPQELVPQISSSDE